MVRRPSRALALLFAFSFVRGAVPSVAQDDVFYREAGSETDEDIPQLVIEATKGDWNTRIKAVHALGRLGSLEGLGEGVTDGDWQIRLTAVHWLGRQGDAGVPILARVLRTEPCRIIRLASIHWLGSIGPKAVPALRDALGESSPMIRLTSAYWLNKIESGEAGDESPPPAADDPGLLRGATDEDLRGCAAVNLPPSKVVLLPEPEQYANRTAADPRRDPTENPGPDGAPMEEESAPLPRRPPPRRPAAGKSAKKQSERTEALKLLADARPPKRAEEYEDEEPFTPEVKRTTETLKAPAAAQAPENPLPPAQRPPVRPPEKPLPDAAEPLSPADARPQPTPELGPKLTGAPEEKLGTAPTWRLVRGEGNEGYDLSLSEPETGKPAHDPIPDLMKALRSSNWRNRYRAADLLGMMGVRAAPAVPDLITAVKDKHSAVRASAALALGNIGKPADGAVPVLTRALRDRHADVRYSAAVALGRMGTPAADRAFQRHLRAEAARMIDRGD